MQRVLRKRSWMTLRVLMKASSVAMSSQRAVCWARTCSVRAACPSTIAVQSSSRLERRGRRRRREEEDEEDEEEEEEEEDMRRDRRGRRRRKPVEGLLHLVLGGVGMLGQVVELRDAEPAVGVQLGEEVRRWGYEEVRR